MIVRNQTIITPPVSSSILSITRDSIFALAGSNLALEVEIDRTELYIADEAFLCGSAAEISPIHRLIDYNWKWTTWSNHTSTFISVLFNS